MEIFGQQLVNGITLGGMYALIALGYTLVYGIMLMINFAHAEMFMGGAFVGLFTLTFLSQFDFLTGSALGIITLFLLTFLVAGVSIGLLGVLIERIAYRPLRNAPRLAALISAIAVSILLQQMVLLWVTARTLPFPNDLMPSGALEFGGVTITYLQIIMLVSTVLLLVILDTFISKTKIGKAMRATSQDRDAAGLMGIDINKVIGVAFFVGPALGAAAGIFAGLYYGSVKFDMGFIPGIKSFTAAVIGGIGNLRGAMLGGLLIGLLEAMAAGYISSGYRDVIVFGALLLVLTFRPGGILGRSTVEKV
ncbi:MAG: branched-chain amino acid ABC transporter permease [Actinobacteria bacterium]|nr:branched-chain amino acid ABC transporter permease [Actinomycetota bacterium]